MGSSTIKPKASIPRLILSEPGDLFAMNETENVHIYDRHTFELVARIYWQGSEAATRHLAQQVADHLNGPED